MRALLLALVLAGLFLCAVIGQQRWTQQLLRTRDLALGHPGETAPVPPGEDWSLLIVGRPSGTDPLPYPERGWASPAVLEEESAPGNPLAGEADPDPFSQAETGVAPDFVYRIQHGDTLGAICQGHYGSARSALLESVAKHNGLSSRDAIREGSLLYLPDPAGL